MSPWLATGAVALQLTDFQMKLTRKILKFTEPLTYRRGWRRAQRAIYRVQLKPMLAQIDWDRAQEIQQRYANSTAGYAKYADIEPWLRLNRERVQDLNLHRSEPKRVLDLGCGAGAPVVQYMAERGLRVTGVDSSPTLISLCRQRLPEHEFLVGDMRSLRLARQFDGVLAWDSFFHLAFSGLDVHLCVEGWLVWRRDSCKF